ncbi:hypothetical protein ANANG_G00060810 [Anguilla anguilla]|uniref:KANL2-like probable zinc-finger domain-containing protein n=1 Tax=Anguilla anguilla TaxID=7936 RepID=A0A9D3MNQ4_ANGAN|nr:hypothetical protein ANANG_G00060810 [Anguilla anguilla]
MRAAAFAPPPACLARLQRLVQLCSQRQQQHGDLFPHLGLDWSEDSAEDEDEMERVPPYQYSCRLQERCLQDNSDEEADGSRSTRLARLCSYLQQKYKHLCRQERAAMRQKRYRYAFRKALLRAASKDPDCTGQLIQELHRASQTPSSAQSAVQRDAESGLCTGHTKGQACESRALPFTRHCFQHILLNRSQQLFTSCTAKFADGQQCAIPVFDITHQTPLCDEHAKKMDNFLRGDSNRRGNLGMPSSLALPSQSASIRSPSTPDLSTDELPDDITNDITDIPNDLELNQEDFSDVLPRLPDDLQDFDLFEGKNGELLPTTEEAEELVRALQAMSSYTDSLVCLSSMGELTQSDAVDHRTMAVFSGPGVQGGAMGDLLNGRIPAENFSSLELDENLLHPRGEHFPRPSRPTARPPPPPPPPPPPRPPSSRRAPHGGAALPADAPLPPPGQAGGARLLAARQPLQQRARALALQRPHLLPPRRRRLLPDRLAPPAEVPLGGVPPLPWNSLPLPLTDPAQFGNLPKQQLPQFSAAFGHQLAAHSGIPKDVQPSHSSTAPPSGFSIASATAASANSAMPPFTTQ